MKKKIARISLKAIIAGGVAIIVFGGGFVLANKAMFLSSANKTEIIPTKYVEAAPVFEEDVSYQKADYSIVEKEVLPCTNENAISAEVAAELGAQYLWDMFKADLDGKQIHMGYQVDPQRATGYWCGDVYKNGVEIDWAKDENVPSLVKYSFAIEAISGTRGSAYHNVEADENKETISYNKSEADEYYKNNCEEYLTLAKTYAEKQLPSEPVKTEFDETRAILAPGYAFVLPSGLTAIDESQETDPDIVLVSPHETFEATFVIIDITVTDENGNQVWLSIDTTSKELLEIWDINIEDNPDSIG